MSKTIGILGGMGPLATADLFRKITCLTKASCDNDHIRVYIDSNARIPDRTAAILSGGTNPVPEMTSALRHLEACGADCIIMPCNTAHYFLPQPLTQQADAAAHAERPKAVCQKRRVRPGLLHPACVFLRCHLHLPAPPFADSLPGAAGAYPFFVKEGRFHAFFPSP